MEFKNRTIDLKPTTNLIIANTNSTGITLTFENISVISGIIVSIVAISTFAFKITTSINKIFFSISQIQEELKGHSTNSQKINDLERKLELHLQEYINRKDVVQMVLGQLNEKIDHKFRRNLFYTRDIQRFLQRDTNFIIREYEEQTIGNEE